jgi:hypothetical protein
MPDVNKTTPDSTIAGELEELLIVTIGQLMINADSYPNVGQIVEKILPLIQQTLDDCLPGTLDDKGKKFDYEAGYNAAIDQTRDNLKEKLGA